MENLKLTDEEIKQMLSSHLRMQQRELFAHSIFSIEKTMSKEFEFSMGEEIVKDAMYSELAKHICNHNPLIRTEEPFCVRFRQDLLVLNKGQLNDVLQYLLKSLSDEQIKQIRES